MDVMVKARELAELLGDSRELSRLKLAEAALENDSKGMALLEDYRLIQVELVNATRENFDEADINKIRDRLMAKQEEIDSNPAIAEFNKAKDEFDALMNNVNNVISFMITGELCTPSKCSSCSGGCGSHS